MEKVPNTPHNVSLIVSSSAIKTWKYTRNWKKLELPKDVNKLTWNKKNTSFLPKFTVKFYDFPLNLYAFFENSKVFRKHEQKIQFLAFPKPVNVRKVAKKGFKCILSPPIPAAISSSPSTSMKKGCWIPRHVVVDNQRHIWRVDASSGEIGSDQYPRLKLLEAREDPQPLLLVKACGNARMGQSIRISIFPCVIYWKSKDTVRCRFDCLILLKIHVKCRNESNIRKSRY